MKRSLGVTLVGGGLIIGFGLSFIQPFLNPRKLIYDLRDIYAPPLQLVWLISSLILVGFVVAGLQILQLKELGRSLAIFLAIIDIPHLVVGKAIYNNYQLQPAYLRNFFLISLSVLINLALLYYLYHPKIKRQFS